MKLDQARIVIRERNFGELLGLALQVSRAHFGSLLMLGAIGVAVPLMANYFLLRGFLSRFEYDHNPGGYWWAMAYLIAIEAPIATAPITLYLGQMTFAEQISMRALWSNFWGSLPQMFVLQFVVRAVLIPLFLLPYLRAPYLSELILLERNRLFVSKSQPISTMKRSANLHRNNGGELFSRWLLSLAAGGLLLAMLAVGVIAGLSTLFSVNLDEIDTSLYVIPVCLWMVVAFFAVVRFLSYLDLRICREGWEIELLMRAEAERMRAAMAFG